MYFVTGVLKTRGDPWWDGTAIYYALSLDHFALPLGERLLEYPGLLAFLTHSVLLLEIGGPLLLFSPKWTDACRVLVIGALVAFQTGLATTMSLGLFPVGHHGAPTGLPARCGLGMDCQPRKPTLPAGDGGPIRRDRRCVAPRRVPAASAGCSGAIQDPRDDRLVRGELRRCVFLVVLILLNARSFAPSLGKLPGEDWLVRTAYLDQAWGMFVTPGESGFWAVVGGRRADGRWIDLMRDGRALDLSRPPFPLGIYPNRRWATLFEAVSRRESVAKNVAPGIANYLCRAWNEQNPQNAIHRSVIYLMWERTLLDGSHSAPTKVIVHDGPCPK